MTELLEPTDGGYLLRLHTAEIDLLEALGSGLESTLDAAQPEHPVIARLFPAAVDGDDEADRELRRLMRDDLLEQRRAGLRNLTDLLARARPAGDDDRRADDLTADDGNHTRVVTLTDDEAHLVLGVINDLRIAVAAQLPAAVLARDERPEDRAVAYRLDVLDHLAWMQHHLLAALDPDAVRAESDTDTDEDET
ncbi:MAG: DUF2017 family protein [Nitriliruptoraceae bacterium]